MLHTRTLIATSLLALTSAPAFADVTADDVWVSIQKTLEDGGYTVSVADTARNGATLMLAGTMVSSMEGALVMNLGDIRLRETGDGRVQVSYPDVMRGSIDSEQLQNANTVEETMPGQARPTTKAEIEFRQKGMTMIASGDPELVTYEYDIPDATINISGTSSADAAASSDTFKASIDLKDISGANRVVEGPEGTVLGAVFQAGEISGQVDGTSPEARGDTNIQFRGSIADIAGQYVMNANQDVLRNLDGSEEALVEVLSTMQFEESISYGKGTLFIEVEGPDPRSSIEVQASIGGGTGAIKMTPEGMAYKTRAHDMIATANKLPIPVPPVSISYDAVSSTIVVPFPPEVLAGHETGDANISIGIENMSFSDGIWMMIDPMGAFDHEPLSVDVNLGAGITWTASLADIFTQTSLPLEVTSASVKSFFLKGLGAEIEAAGGVAFTAKPDFMLGGMPGPVGTIDVKMSGINALLGDIKTSGMVAEQELQMVQMMLGIFTTAIGDDQLTSQVEFTRDGGALVNGNPVK